MKLNEVQLSFVLQRRIMNALFIVRKIKKRYRDIFCMRFVGIEKVLH